MSTTAQEVTDRVCVRACVCVCVCVSEYRQKRKLPLHVQGGNTPKLSNTKESAIVRKHRCDPVRGEAASESVAMGNITQFNPVSLAYMWLAVLTPHSL